VVLAACSGGGSAPPSTLTSEGPLIPVLAGVLANAGPDQMVLEGTFVLLDGRASQLAEDLRVPSVRWSQRSGTPVVLEDPTSPVARFLAPRSGADAAPLTFVLTLDDGSRVSRDEVNVFVWSDAATSRLPVVLLGGADQRVAPGSTFSLPVRAQRFGCEDPDPRNSRICPVDAAGKPLLDGTGLPQDTIPYPYCIEQVQGPPVAIPEGFACDQEKVSTGVAELRAPDSAPALLVFKIDARANFDNVEPTGLPFANRIRPAPDFVRIRVSTTTGNRDCRADIQAGDSRNPVSGLRNAVHAQLELTGVPSCLKKDGRRGAGALSVFRPLLGAPLIGDGRGAFPDTALGDTGGASTRVTAPLPPWKRTVAVTYEAIAADDGLWSEPTVVAFEQDTGEVGKDEDPLVARLPPVACSVAGRRCAPDDPILLDGSESTQGPGLEYCWTQNLGPQLTNAPSVALLPLAERCLPTPDGLQRLIRIPPPTAQDPSPRTYVFQLVVQRTTRSEGGVTTVERSLPDTTIFAQQPPDNLPPVAVTLGSDTLGIELGTVFLDGRCSYDRDVTPVADATCGRTLLHKYHWSQSGPDDPPVLDLVDVPCPMGGIPPVTFPLGTCARATIPRVHQNTTFHFRLEVEDEDFDSATSDLEVRVLDKLNEPPVSVPRATTPRARTTTTAIVVRAGTDVILDPRGSFDPNVSDVTGRDRLASCRWTYLGTELEQSATRLPAEAGDLHACAGDRFRFHVPAVAPNARFNRHEFTLQVFDDPPCLFSDGGCPTGEDQPRSDARTVTVYALYDGPWVLAGAVSGLGTPNRPFGTLQEALALARDDELNFTVVHLAQGKYTIDAEGADPLQIAGRTLIGGYGPSFGQPSGNGPRTELYTAQGVGLGDAAGLVHLDVYLQGSGQQALDVQDGKVQLTDVNVTVNGSTRDPAYAVHVGGGATLQMSGGSARGRTAQDQGSSTGLHCDRGTVNASGSLFSGGGGAGTRRGMFLGEGCSADLRDSTMRGVDPPLVASNRSGSKDGIAIGLDSASIFVVWVAREASDGVCSLQGGRADEAAIGARLLRGYLDGCDLEGGIARVRTGLEVSAPGQSACQGEDCVFASGGTIRGGSGTQAAGESRGVWAHGGVELLELDSVLGETGTETNGGGRAYGLQLEGGGAITGVRSIRAGGPAQNGWGILTSGRKLTLQDSDIVGGTGIAVRAVGLDARHEVELAGANHIVASSGSLASITQGVSVGSTGVVRQIDTGNGPAGAILDGGPAATTSTGLSVSGSVELVNFRLLAGPAPSVTVAESRGTSTVLSSGVLRGRTGSDDLTLLSVLDGAAPELRNVILDVGSTDNHLRAHVRVSPPGVLPRVMNGLIFSPDPSCELSGGYVNWPGGRACDLSTIAAAGAETFFVVDPLFVDAARENFHLLEGSTAIGKGVLDHLPRVDADGVPRPQGAGPDIGPYER
jgi:hypothetical protein